MRFARLDAEGYSDPILTIPTDSPKTLVLQLNTTGVPPSADNTLRVDVLAETPLLTESESLWTDGVVPDISGNLVRNLTLSGGTLVY